MDPTGKNEKYFDITNTAHCSLNRNDNELIFTTHHSSREEPTAGVLITYGIVGSYSSVSERESVSTFISDGGVSWKLAFGHPVLYAFADFGNIIVVIPNLSGRKQRVYAKFFFSLDQVRTWEEHQLEEPLPADYIVFDSSGLVVLMRFATYGGQLLGHDSHSVQEVFTVIDFSRIFGGKACGIEDFGTWHMQRRVL